MGEMEQSKELRTFTEFPGFVLTWEQRTQEDKTETRELFYTMHWMAEDRAAQLRKEPGVNMAIRIQPFPLFRCGGQVYRIGRIDRVIPNQPSREQVLAKLDEPDKAALGLKE